MSYPTNELQGAQNLVNLVLALREAQTKNEKALEDFKDEIKGGASSDFDSFLEVVNLINTNKSAIEALQLIAQGHVKYDDPQNLTEAQQAQGRANIDAPSKGDVADAKKAGTDAQSALSDHLLSRDAHPVATSSQSGFMSAEDKAKLDKFDGGLTDNAVQTRFIADGAVTTAKIASGVTITGSLVGNAETATKATKDAKGNVIDSFYAPASSLSSLASKTELQQGLAAKQPAGDYVLASTYESGLATKQDKGDYATTKALTDGLATKQAVGDYATNADLAGKQDKGDYATKTELSNGLATKQNAGDYATVSQLNSGLAGKQPVGNYVLYEDLESALGNAGVGDGSITVNKLADVIDLGGLS